MNALLIFAMSVLVARLWRGRDIARDWLIDGLIGFAGTVCVGAFVLFIYIVFLTPSHIYREQKGQIELLTNRVNWLTQFSTNMMQANKFIKNENERLKTAMILSEATNKSLTETISKINNQSP